MVGLAVGLEGGQVGGWVFNYSESNATSWPILQVKTFQFSAKLKFQDGPSVAVEPSECLTSISSSNTSPA